MGNSSLRTLAVALALLMVGTVAARGADTVIEAPEAGFRLTIPGDVGWAHQAQRDADGGLTSLALGPPAAGGAVQLSVQVSVVADDSDEAVRDHVARLRASIVGDASITEVVEFGRPIAGRPAHGLSVVQSAAGTEYRVHVVFLRARGIQYRVQLHAPSGQFDEQRAIADRVLDGLELIDLDAATAERVRLRGLAARCGSLVEWAVDWEEAARRARARQRLVVVSVHAQPGVALGNALDERVFMSPEVVALMEHRFVGWRWSAGRPAPFVDHEVFGLGGSTFGVGLLVCTPDGRVVRQVFLPEPALVADALRAVLREHPGLAPPPLRATQTKAGQVEFLVDSGQLDAAAELLGPPDRDEPAAVTFQRARLHRVRRDGAAARAALRSIDAGRATGADGAPTPARRLLEEAGVLVGMGRNAAARDAVTRCLDRDPDDETRAEALMLEGALDWADGAVERTRERWTALTRALPDQPAAWMAAAGLVGPALEIDLQPDLGWPTEAAVRLSALPPAAADGASLEIAVGLAGAVDWLLDGQRADGGWDVPFDLARTHPAPDPIAMATQAIGTLALARAGRAGAEGDPARAERCRAAAARALRRYLADRDLGREHPRPIAFMDYTCWGSSYGLLCVAALLDPALGMLDVLADDTRAALEAEAGHLVADLVRVQAPNGGWSYYVSGEVDGASPGAAMSFTTATVLLALHSAADRSIEVPAGVLDRGHDCLASLRGTNGAYAYSRFGTGPYAAGEVGPASAAARGPVCTLALRRGGRLEAGAMAPAFATYVEHLGVFGAEARKALMHAGPEGQGSHYLLYDYSTAAEALRATNDEAIGPELRARARAAILRELARCRSADGSFIDNPIIGSAAGTGLAVLTLLDLAER